MDTVFAQLRDLNLTSVEETGRVLGSGAYGEVVEVRLSGLKCAGKKLHNEFFRQSPRHEQKAILSRFVEECLSLSRLRHPNIVQLVGVHFLRGSQLPVMVMELLPMSLSQCLERHQQQKIPGYIKTSILCDVSLALLYLHSQTPPLIHRDLTANNVLLTSNMSAKLADLGVAKIVNLNPAQLSARMTQCPGTPAYMPPESLSNAPHYNEKLDVFSFGNLILHVCTHQWPLPAPLLYYDPTNPDNPTSLTEIQRRLQYLDMMDVQSPLRALAERCLHNMPLQRPTTATIVSELEQFHHLDSTPSFLDMIVENSTLREQLPGMGNTEIARMRQEIENLRKEREEEVSRLNCQLREKDATIAQLLQAQSPAHQSSVPVHQPPVHQPPVHQPPVHQPPAHQPPAHQPPAHQPPAHQPPAHQPPAHQYPTPVHQSPVPVHQYPPGNLVNFPGKVMSSQTNCELSGNGLKWAVLGKVASFEVQQNILHSPLPVTCQLVTCDGVPTSGCKIIELSDPWRHRVAYVPHRMGPHQLQLRLGDLEAAGSPFAVLVLTAGQLMRTIDGVGGPCGLALTNNHENLIVVERTSNHVSVFGKDGKLKLSFGSAGSSVGQFRDPRGVAVTANDEILITDHANNRIQKFTAQGQFIAAVGSPGDRPLTFHQPIGIAVHPSGKILVTENGGHCVKVFNPNLTLSHKFGSYGSNPGEFLHPMDVAFDSQGMVYVADTHNSRIQKLTLDGTFVAMFGTKGSKEGELALPSSIAINSKDIMYIAEKENGRLSIFTCEGKFVTCFGTSIHHPYGIAVDETGSILVSNHDFDYVAVY